MRGAQNEQQKWTFYSLVTERIIEKLNAGVVPWGKPWRSIGAPRNLVSKKVYQTSTRAACRHL